MDKARSADIEETLKFYVLGLKLPLKSRVEGSTLLENSHSKKKQFWVSLRVVRDNGWVP